MDEDYAVIRAAYFALYGEYLRAGGPARMPMMPAIDANLKLIVELDGLELKRLKEANQPSDSEPQRPEGEVRRHG